MRADFETITYSEKDGVAWVTLDRPEVLNAFDDRMRAELKAVWTGLRRNDDVRCVVLTGAGDRAFTTGIDRAAAMADLPPEGATGLGGQERLAGFGSSPFMYDDPGQDLGPKTNDLWKPVIAAVNGIACGGAFYLLGEVEFVIAAEHATFFDPHVTFGMTAAYEPIQMMSRMPFQELARMMLLGASERLSARRAYEIGLVSEVVPADGLAAAAGWAAERIAAAPPLAVQGTLRALWAGVEHSRGQALGLAAGFVSLGTSNASLREGQQAFESGRREAPRVR